MVSKILAMFGRSTASIHEAAFLLGISAVCSQFLGLIRDRLLAGEFGAGETLDIYYAAFKIPDFLYVTIASLVSVTILLPFLVSRLEGGKSSLLARGFLDNVLSAFFLLMIVFGAVAWFLMPKLSALIVPGFSPAEAVEFVTLSRILLLSPLFLGLSNVLGSVVQAFDKFLLYALTPILYNLGIIFGIVFFYPFWGIRGLVFGVILGAALHFLIQLPTVWRLRLLPRLSVSISFKAFGELVRVAIPRTLTLSAHSLVAIVLTGIGSLFSAGSIAVFNFANNLQTVPLAVVGISYSVAAFPTLARLFSGGSKDKFLEQIVAAARHIIFWSLPITALFIVLRAQIVRTILGVGNFDWTNTRLVAAALAIFSFSIVAQSLVLLFVRGYYAAGNTKTPLLVNIFSSGLIIFLAFVFVRGFEVWSGLRYFFEALFRVQDVSGTVVLALPLAWSVGLLVNLLLYFVIFERDFPSFFPKIFRTLRHSFYAAVFIGFFTRVFLAVFDDVFDLETLPGIFFQGLLSGVLAIIIGIFVLRLLKNQELIDISRAVHTRFWKTKPIQPSPEELI